MPDLERAAVLARFRAGEILVLASVHVLTEGFDVPEVGAVILARRLGHAGTYLQCVGRALRPALGKTSATVIDLCGSVLEHGLPDEERTFSLEGKAIRKSDRLAIRQCAACGCVTQPAPSCPECGTAFPVDVRALPRSAGVGVTEVGPATPRKPWLVRMRAKRGGRCLTCGGGIHVGDPIQWLRGIGAAHTPCGLRRAA